MKYYTEKQALEIAINSAGAAVNYINEVSGEVSGETIKTIAHGSMSKPSTFEIQKQIEAVRGLIAVYNQFKTTGEHLSMNLEDALDGFQVKLKELTETLKQHLGEGQKLEV
jgi:hypothetical protein